MNLSIELKKNNDYNDYNDNLPLLISNYKEKEKHIINSLQDLNEIQQNLAQVVYLQQEKIDTIENNILQTEIRTISALEDIQEADRLFFSYKPIIIGGFIGAILGGPVGFAMGVKWLGGIGTIVGGYTGYKVQKN